MPAGCKRDAGATEGDVTANEDLMREHGVSQRILAVHREAVPCMHGSAQAGSRDHRTSSGWISEGDAVPVAGKHVRTWSFS